MDYGDYSDWRLGPAQYAQAIEAAANPLAPTPADIAKALQGQYWRRTWEGATQDPQIMSVDKMSAQYPEGVKGWTACDKDKRACQIIMLRNANRDCVERHERMHAAGLDHPNYPQAYICPE